MFASRTLRTNSIFSETDSWVLVAAERQQEKKGRESRPAFATKVCFNTNPSDTAAAAAALGWMRGRKSGGPLFTSRILNGSARILEA
jgi:hypothetical protein